MKVKLVALLGAFALALGASFAVNAGLSLPDGDSDGIPDEWDNCSAESNISQTDSNLDGFGNLCDTDYNNDNGVGFPDFTALSATFLKSLGDGAYNPDVDCNDDDGIGFPDFTCLSGDFLGAPGPSGLACADPFAGSTCTGI